MKVALLGNPNVGKTSFFNVLTGLNQKTGNFPGVTVEKKSGYCALNKSKQAEIIDLPGTYSLQPKSADEKIVFDYLVYQKEKPDVVLLILDQTNLRRNLLLCSQVLDLGLPVIICLNLVEEAEKRGFYIDEQELSKEFSCPVFKINARNGDGIDTLKETLVNFSALRNSTYELPDSIHLPDECLEPTKKSYRNFLHLVNNSNFIKEDEINKLVKEDTISRYQKIDAILSNIQKETNAVTRSVFGQLLSKVSLHHFWGYFLFIAILFVIFQSVFAFASYPMDIIDSGIGLLAESLENILPENTLSKLLIQGIIPGIGGVIIFIPQIAFLFIILSILEESGYMSRVMFLMDPILRKFGLNGRSVIPMVSATACAIPAIMSARTIENPKERIITIMVAPLVSCSARLPVYAVLVSLAVPEIYYFGFINLQGLTFMGLYLLGFAAAFIIALVFKYLVKSNEKSRFIMELPEFRMPHWKNIFIYVYQKTKAFVVEAGKIILAISMVLWLLASYGPSDKMDHIAYQVRTELKGQDSKLIENQIASKKLEASYAGILGKSIEPLIEPLGYDWKIGIALITSFAAREVFVGTISTIFSLGEDASESSIKKRLKSAINPKTGKPIFNTATSMSLLIFYVFAMQCLSTLAITKKETNSWKWTFIQLFYMSFLAYGSAFITYNIFSTT